MANYSVEQFVAKHAHYYINEFARIQEVGSFVWSFNTAVAIWGALWARASGAWRLFWITAAAEIFALFQIGRGGASVRR
jgi:hypothetical protein